MRYKLNPFERLVLEILLMILMDYPHQLRSKMLPRVNEALRNGSIDEGDGTP